MNAEFQRIARRDKKAFFNDQCKEIEENNRMGKTRDLFEKIREENGKDTQTDCRVPENNKERWGKKKKKKALLCDQCKETE